MNNGRTPLIYAAFADHEAVAKLLLDHGADVTATVKTAMVRWPRGSGKVILRFLLR